MVMKDNQIIHLGSNGAIDFVAIPETHPIWTADVADFSPVWGELMRQALVDAVEASQPLFHKPKGDMSVDTWNVMAVLAGVRKWFQDAYTRLNTLKQGASLNNQHILNLYRNPHSIAKPKTEIVPAPVKLQITEDDVLAEYDFWVNTKNAVNQMVAQMQAMVMPPSPQTPPTPSNQRRGVAQALGLPPTPSSTSGTAEYGGAEKLPRSKKP